jgi:hypothetical protein
MANFKIKKNRENLSDAEIGKQMNFDTFISGYTFSSQGWFSGSTKLITVISSITSVIIIAGLVIFNSGKKEESTIKPFVSPPISVLDRAADIYTVNPSADTIIIHSTGTLINIPALAFVNAEGKDIAGNVEIHYREFHDPIDILLSGIPMDYDSAGITFQLESAGMFEITAKQNDQPVFIKPGKAVLVNMISHSNNPTDYNIYNLDTAKRKWEYVSENTSENKTCFPAFEDRFPVKNQLLSESPGTIEKPVLPKKSNQAALNFSIDYKKEEFPELAAYEGIKFEPVQSNDKSYTTLAKKTWDDVKIEKIKDEEVYLVTFIKAKESHSIRVIPVVDEKDYNATLKDYSSRQKRYESLLASKKKEELEKNDSLYKINERFAGGVSRSDLNERFKSFINNSFSESSQDLLTYRMFAVNRFGTWNCDQPFSFFEGSKTLALYNAHFTDEGKEELNLKNIYMIRRDKNSIYPVPEKSFQTFPVCEIIDIMVGITYDNRVVYCKDAELKNAEVKGNNIFFRFHSLGTDVVNPSQLKNILRI